MAQNETWLNHDMLEAVRVQYLDGNLFSMDNAGNLIGVNLTRDGVDYSGGGSVSANVIRADGSTVSVVGALSGNVATVVLPQAAYAVPGVTSIVVKLTVSGEVTTIAAVVANVYQSSTDIVVDPGTIIPSVQALISAIESAVASIPADYSALWTSLAPAFSTSTNYTAGQYVTYNGGLYRFTVDHAAGAWNSAHVTATNIGANLNGLKSAFNTTLNPIEFSPTITKGYFLATATGKRTSGNKYAYVAGWAGYPKRIAINLDSSTYEGWVSYYTQNGDITTPSGYLGWNGVITSGIIYIPENAKKFGISIRRVDQAVLSDSDVTAIAAALSAYSATDDTLSKEGIAADAMKVGKLTERYNKAENALLNETDMLIPYAVGGSGFVVYDTGAVRSSSIQSYTDFIDITNCEKIKYKKIGLITDNTQAGIAFYSSASETSYISGKQCATGQSSTGYTDELETVSVPENAKFVRCSMFTDTTTYGTFEIYAINQTAEDITDLKRNVYIETGYEYKPSQIENNEQIGTNNGVAYSGYTGRAHTGYIGRTIVGDAVSINLTGYTFILFYYTNTNENSYVGYSGMLPCDGSLHIIPNGYAYRIGFYHDPIDTVEFTQTEIDNMAAAITLYGSTKRGLVHDGASVYYAFGDSITYGYDGETHTRSENNYPQKVGTLLDIMVKNNAVVGQGLIKDWNYIHTNYIEGLDMSDACLITISWAYNDYDYYSGINFGEYTDTGDTTFIGKYYTIMKEFQQKCPNAQIILITGYGWGGGKKGPPVVKPTCEEQFTHTYPFADGEKTLYETYEGLEKMANLHGWPCVNQAKGCAINQFNCQTLIGDNIHPTTEGYKVYSNLIAARVAGYYANIK